MQDLAGKAGGLRWWKEKLPIPLLAATIWVQKQVSQAEKHVAKEEIAAARREIGGAALGCGIEEGNIYSLEIGGARRSTCLYRRCAGESGWEEHL
jgi:hypothetical protein